MEGVNQNIGAGDGKVEVHMKFSTLLSTKIKIKIFGGRGGNNDVRIINVNNKNRVDP